MKMIKNILILSILYMKYHYNTKPKKNIINRNIFALIVLKNKLLMKKKLSAGKLNTSFPLRNMMKVLFQHYLPYIPPHPFSLKIHQLQQVQNPV